ncbi:MAG: twin-arginine translocase TatA/TatE family subunit [Anaerolineales bacterium]
MNIFGIGPLEIIFVLIIGILVLGPEGMIEAGRKLGKSLRSIVRSTWWQNIRRGVNEIQHLPQRLMREAELEELKEIRDLTKTDLPKIGGENILDSSSWVGSSPLKTLEELSSEETPKKPSNTEAKSG